MNEKKQFITTPIYYVNGDPHLGHAHTTVMGDIFKRAMKMQGFESFYTTGVDEHGQKNAQEIKKSGLTQVQYLDMQSNKFIKIFESLNINYDFFVRTSSIDHKKGVEEILLRLYKKGKIVKKDYKGLYCPGCEQFKTLSDLDDQGLCPDHHIVPIEEKESNYFFPMEPYRDWLKTYINNNPEWISPSFYIKKVNDMLSEPLPDLCVSRPKSRVKLGVELPFDKDYVAYVWFDALINYITSLGYPTENENFRNLWDNSYHLMAKDIIKTHCIYWPIMLNAIGIAPARKNLIHGFWVGEDGRKMSKSLGNGVNPQAIVDKYGDDSLRAFLAARMNRNEARIGEKIFNEFYNSFLANTIGNVYLRSVKLLEKYANGCLPDISIRQEDLLFLEELKLKAINSSIKKIDFDEISKLMMGIDNIGIALNRYIDSQKPWSMAKDKDRYSELMSIIKTCLEGICLLFEVAWPIIPTTSDRVLNQFGIMISQTDEYYFRILKLKAGIKPNIYTALFPKII